MDDCGMTVDEGTVILRFFTISSMMERTPNLSGNGSGLVGTISSVSSSFAPDVLKNASRSRERITTLHPARHNARKNRNP